MKRTNLLDFFKKINKEKDTKKQKLDANPIEPTNTTSTV